MLKRKYGGGFFRLHPCRSFLEFHYPLLMAGGAKMTALAGEGKKILVVKVFALHLGIAIV
jgi:hypothetical protein